VALSLEERQEIEAEVGHCPDRHSACIDAMLTVQRHRGWVSNEGLRDIAEFLDMTVAELDGVATFYNLIYRQPVGRTVLLVCNSVSCWIMGCDRLFEAIGARLGIRPGETTADNRCTLLPICCLGACDRAPVLLAGEELYGPLDPEKNPEQLIRVLDQFR
jgi:NADH-quinone oxidoreductase subunit E